MLKGGNHGKDRKYIITAIQVAKGKIKISYDASGDMGTESYTLISAEKQGRNYTKPCLICAVTLPAFWKLIFKAWTIVSDRGWSNLTMTVTTG